MLWASQFMTVTEGVMARTLVQTGPRTLEPGATVRRVQAKTGGDSA